jgi:hypothetical protein
MQGIRSKLGSRDFIHGAKDRDVIGKARRKGAGADLEIKGYKGLLETQNYL